LKREFVGWAKPAGRANARVDGVPTIFKQELGTAKGAFAARQLCELACPRNRIGSLQSKGPDDVELLSLPIARPPQAAPSLLKLTELHEFIAEPKATGMLLSAIMPSHRDREARYFYRRSKLVNPIKIATRQPAWSEREQV
jgi:hypothetical protein